MHTIGWKPCIRSVLLTQITVHSAVPISICCVTLHSMSGAIVQHKLQQDGLVA